MLRVKANLREMEYYKIKILGKDYLKIKTLASAVPECDVRIRTRLLYNMETLSV